MHLKANKFSGSGNEIILIDFLIQKGSISSVDIKKIVKTGQANFDQLIAIEPPSNKETDLKVKIFNQDGSEAENCVNGARCLAKYVFDSVLIPKKKFVVETDAGEWKIISHPDNEYSVQLKPPNFEIGLDYLPKPNKKNRYDLILSNCTLEVFVVNLGNPHAILFDSNIFEKPLEDWGKELQNSQYFPDGVNLGLAEIVTANKINLRVFERGVGETRSCGSSACAAVIAGNKEKKLKNKVEVNFKLGKLVIKYEENKRFLTARGGADFLEKLTLEI